MPSYHEALTLDGLALNDLTNYRVEGFSAPPPRKRYEWAQGADADGAALVRDPLFDNREITVRIRVEKQSTMDAALAKIGSIVAKLEEAEKQENGLALTWTPGANSTKTLTAYVLSGEIEEIPITSDGQDAGWWFKFPVLTVKLICKPFLYGAEVTMSSGNSSTPFVTLTAEDIPGDVPAEARLIVTDGATQSRRYLEWGLEQRHYNSATALLRAADDLDGSGTYAGTWQTRTGAYDPNATGVNVVRATLTTTPVVVTTTNWGGLSQAHVGTFRVKARVWASSLGVKVRLAWQEGDGPFRANPYASVVAEDAFVEVDLGLITIPAKLLGTQRWIGRIEAYSDTPGDTIDVNYLVYVPAGEGYGKARAEQRFETPTVFAARDEFDQSAGNLNAKTAPVGGAWATSGATTDLAVEATGHTAERSAVSDSGLGRFAISGLAAAAAQIVQVDFKTSAIPTSNAFFGLVARWIDANNRASAYADGDTVWFTKAVGGSGTNIKSAAYALQAGAWYTIRLVILADGRWSVWIGPRGSVSAAPVLSGQDSDMATGAALDDGQVGFRDYWSSSSAATRNYDNFFAAVPASDAVIFSGQSAEIRHDGAIREDSSGTYGGHLPHRGSPFLLPEAGDEDRTSRILVKAHRGDIEAMAAPNVTDSLTAQILYRPRYIAAPR